MFEPASIPADVLVNSIQFVSLDVGWASTGQAGEGGTLYHTRDGGATWTRVHGDPGSSDPAYQRLHFIDANHGWVLQWTGVNTASLLRTRDGRTWEPHGAIEYSWALVGYQFLSPSVGLALDGNNNISRILKTTDGGRTWGEVFHGRACVTVPLDGLTRTLDCPMEAMHFPSPRVGYAVGQSRSVLFVAKTEDGGESWRVHAVPDLVAAPGLDFDVPSLLFLNEETGIVGLSDGRFYRTSDGGRTWTASIGTRGTPFAFADPEVGAARTGYFDLGFTTDGGRSWTARAIDFPAKVHALSFPRRDRGYVAGEHGMVFRYRVVPATRVPAGALAAPLLLPFRADLTTLVEELGTRVEALRTAAGEAGWAPSCCEGAVSGALTTVEQIGSGLPGFLDGQRPVSLLLAAARWAVLLPARVGDMEGALSEFRGAPDAASAEAALGRLEAAVAEFGRATRQAFGEDVPEPDEWAVLDATLGPKAGAPEAPASGR